MPLAQPPPQVQPTELVPHYVCWFVCALVMALGWRLLPLTEAINEEKLHRHGRKAFAVMTEWREARVKRSVTYEFQYEFAVPGREELFARSNAEPRQNIWTKHLTYPEWAALRGTQFEVVYLPNNPWVNRPVLAHVDVQAPGRLAAPSTAGTGRRVAWTGVLIATILLAGPLAFIAVGCFQLRRARRKPAIQQIGSYLLFSIR